MFLCCVSNALAAGLPDAVTFSVVIERGDQTTAKRWLSSGLPPNFEGKTIGSGIMIGAWEGNLPMMEIFLNAGADINYTNAIGEQALLHAAWKGKLNAVRWLVEHGARLNRDDKAWSALHYAAFAGHREVVAYLLERGADTNALSTNGSTPLMMAAREAQQEIAQTLLAAGARTDIVNEHGENAVQWAMRNNNLKIAKMIDSAALSQGAAAAAAVMPLPRSRPVPDRADQLLAEARRLEALGQRDKALVPYRDAMAAIRATERKVDKPNLPLTGVTIRAKRKDPKKQSTGLVYSRARAASANLASKPSSKLKLTKSVGAANDDAVQVLLRKARALEAAGRRAEALAAFRQVRSLIETENRQSRQP